MRGLLAAIVTTSILVLGCGELDATPRPATPTPAAASMPAVPVEPSPVDPAVEFRLSMGLRADEAWVHALASDAAALARADDAGYAFPMTELEIVDLRNRTRDLQGIAEVVEEYGSHYPADFAGAYVDLATSRVVFLAKDRVAMHLKGLPKGQPIDVVRVRWSLADLEAILEPIRNDDAFFVNRGVIAVANINERENIVEITIGSNHPVEDEALVLARYEHDPRIRVQVSGPGLWQGAFGTVILRITDASGRPITPDGAACWLVADDPSAWSLGESERFPIDGTCRFGRVGATGVEAQLRVDPDGFVIGRSRGVVPANGTVTLTVVINDAFR